MTTEEKDLLLKDLCARLPYIPIIQIEEHDWNNLHIDAYDTPFKSYYLEPFIIGEIEIKPYLRPMSSMTEEECKTLGNISATLENKLIEVLPNTPYYIEVAIPDQIDWLNEQHFDYRGLIKKGLALEAPDSMYEH